MKQHLTFLLLFGILLVTSCTQDYKAVVDTVVQPSATKTTQPTETAVPTQTSTTAPTETAVPTQTNTPAPTTTPEPSPTPTVVAPTATATAHITLATASNDGKVTLEGIVVFDVAQEGLPCFPDIAPTVSYAPTYEHFLVIPACIETDNEIFLFRADGTGKQRITGAWDLLNGDRYEWLPDGQSFVYQRINSCCLSPEDIPADAPPVGIVRVDATTGEKVFVAPWAPREYHVVGLNSNGELPVHALPGAEYPIVGAIPHDGIHIWQIGESAQVDNALWLPIVYQDITGWIEYNVGYLDKQFDLNTYP